MVEIIAFNDATYHDPGCWACGRDLDLIMQEEVEPRAALDFLELTP